MTEYQMSNDFQGPFKNAILGVSIDSKNQLEEFSKVLRAGAQMVEMNIASLYQHGPGEASTENISRAEREAIGHLATANAADMSIHAPWAINFAGLDPQKNERSAEYSKRVHQETTEALKFADDVSGAMGRHNLPVIFHASYDELGAPDRTSKVVLYDKEAGKAMPITPAIPNYNIEKFKEVYGNDIYDRLKDGLSESREGDTTRLLLSPEKTLEFMKIQNKEEYSQQLAQIETSRHNMENLQIPDLTNRLLTAEAQGNVREVETINRQLQSMNDVLHDLERKERMIEKESKDLDNRFVLYDKEAPKLAAQGIKDAAMYSAFQTKTKPMILVENPMTPSMSLSRPEETGKAIEEARRLFVDEAMGRGLDKEEAKALSTEIIGMNLDVGHVNTFKSVYRDKINPRTGREYTENELNKMVVEMSTKAKDYIKRYHLHDNMGNMDAHLPLGEGNAPVKEVYEALKNAGIEAPAIMEVFGGPGGIERGLSVSEAYMGMPLYDNVAYTPFSTYAAQPYSSLIGDYSAYTNLDLKNDFLSYTGFSGIFPALGGGYREKGRGEGGGFSSSPMF